MRLERVAEDTRSKQHAPFSLGDPKKALKRFFP
jgi:hypothetical protein